MPRSNIRIDEITLVLIVALIALFVGISNQADDSQVTEAEKITGVILGNDGIGFAANGVINDTKMEQVQIMDYEDFKDSLNAKKDFCIYIEDELGNILLSKGDPQLNEDGIYCRE